MADVQQPMTEKEAEERLRYWEERIRAGQQRGRELDEAQRAAWIPEAPAGTFPETPDSLKNGNVDGPSVPQNAGLSSDRHFESGPQRGNVAQDEAQQEVEDEIARLRRNRRGNVEGAPNYARREQAEGKETGQMGGLISKSASPQSGRQLLYQR